MKQKLKQLVAALIFIILAFEVFIHCTYLFRNTNRMARQSLLGLYCEEDNSLDVVCVGASSIFTFWSPMQAWDSYGFTSYNFSTSAMSRATILTAIKTIRKSQSPELLIIEVRPFLSLEELTSIEYPERNVLDSIDYDFNRLNGVKYLFDNADLSKSEIMTEYMELAQYHNNKSALAQELNWELIDNRLNSSPDGNGYFKGFPISTSHAYQSKDKFKLSDEVSDEVSKLYMDVLQYCRKNDLEILLVATPWMIMDEDRSRLINKMKLIAEKYGYGFIDGNQYFDEMDLDIMTDFKDRSHVNILGAKKWTEFVGNYLVQNYNMPDHRNDNKYDSWNMVYKMYEKEEETAISQIWDVIQNHDTSLENEKKMRETDDYVKWFKLANDENISVLVGVNSYDDPAPSIENTEILKWFGINESCMGVGKKYYALYCNRMIHLQTTEDKLEGTIGGLEIPFLIRNENKITIQEKEYSMVEGKIHFLAFDNNLNQVVDFVELHVSAQGDLTVVHLDFD